MAIRHWAWELCDLFELLERQLAFAGARVDVHKIQRQNCSLPAILRDRSEFQRVATAAYRFFFLAKSSVDCTEKALLPRIRLIVSPTVNELSAGVSKRRTRCRIVMLG